MRVTFISNFLNHHQIPFCNAMYDLIGNDYHFISTVPINNERKNMKCEINDLYDYEIKAYESNKLMKKAIQLADESDIVIIGSAPDSFIKNRLKNGKLTFKYSERLYKQGISIGNFARTIISSYIHHGKFQKYPIYMLCASAYTTTDLNIFNNYVDRTYKWGYFPEVKEYNIEQLINRKNRDFINILWAGRFLSWKHPEKAIEVAEYLKNNNISFKLRLIGNGKIFEEMEQLVKEKELSEYVEFLGVMPPDEVRRYMEDSNIFMFTSDFNEGWGAVLNESMNSGCAVVASHAIGSVPFLIYEGINGLIYNNDDIDDLCQKVLLLTSNKLFREKLGTNAYFTMKNTWNAKVAATRFLQLAESIFNREVPKFVDGPCSKAYIIKNNWYKKGEYSIDSRRL